MLRSCFALHKTWSSVSQQNPYPKNVQRWSSLETEFAMEYNDGFLAGVTAGGWRRFLDMLSKQEILDFCWLPEVNSTGNMAAFMLEIESAVNDMKVLNL